MGTQNLEDARNFGDAQNFEAAHNSDLMVHAVIGRLFEGPEPTHRADLAEGAIAHGTAVTRRRGFAVAGATLSVLAVVAGAAVVAGGSGGSGDWSLGPSARISPQAYEDAAPTYADRQREITEQLPKVFGALLPAGVTVTPDPKRAGSGGGTYMKTGDYEPETMLRSGGRYYPVEFAGPTTADDLSGYSDAFAKEKAAPIAVAGGSIRMAVVPDGTGPARSGFFDAWYEFKPADAAKPAFRFMLYSGEAGETGTTPIDAAAFKKMVESPGFAGLQQLFDPSVQASAAAVRERYGIEAKINAEAEKVLPPGFRLKLNPGAPGQLELVGPGGVNTFQWGAISGTQQQIDCPARSLCFAVPDGRSATVGPDGRARLGSYEGWTGSSKDSSVGVSVYGKPMTGSVMDPIKPGQPAGPLQLGKPVETAPQGPGLTPQQAMAIVKAPGVAKVIADVQKLAAMPY
jgi:hypothetical protein